MMRALDRFGFGSLGLKREYFLHPQNVIQLGYPPNRIDLIMSPTGVDFETCFAAKNKSIVEDVEVNFISLSHLKDNKRACGRHQDLADLENLE